MDLWMTLGRGRDEVRARSEALYRRTRETGLELLGRASEGATTVQRTLASRRAHLNGAPIQRLERRVLVRLEDVLDRMGLGLRAQINRLTPGARRPAIEAHTPEPHDEAEIVSSIKRTPAARAETKKKRIRVAVGEVSSERAAATRTTASARSTSSARTTSSGRAAAPKSRAKKSERPTARRAEKKASSTRWVSPPAVDVDALAALSAKELAARIPKLEPEVCRALLTREKQTKKRKTVIDALASRLPS